MRKFIIDMTMSYDFKVTIEAESEEEAKAKFTSTPLEKLEDYPRFYKDYGKVK
jgi:hypothetical protein